MEDGLGGLGSFAGGPVEDFVDQPFGADVIEVALREGQHQVGRSLALELGLDAIVHHGYEAGGDDDAAAAQDGEAGLAEGRTMVRAQRGRRERTLRYWTGRPADCRGRATWRRAAPSRRGQLPR